MVFGDPTKFFPVLLLTSSLALTDEVCWYSSFSGQIRFNQNCGQFLNSKFMTEVTSKILS